MKVMEQPEPPPESGPPPEAPAPAPRKELPETTGSVAIPDHFRLPFHGKMAMPTSVPSATERRRNLERLQRRKRRRGFLAGLLAGQLLILGLDLGGAWLLRRLPHVKLQAPVGVQAIVFLGMAIGAAVMIAGVAAIYVGMAVRALFGRRPGGLVAAAFRGLGRVAGTALVLGVSMAVILGTAWFLIPREEWRPTADFAKARGRALAEASRLRLKSFLHPSAGAP